MYHLACSVTFKLACSVTFDEQVLYLFQQDMVTIVATSFHTCILHYKMSHRPPAITIQKHNNHQMQLRCSLIVDFNSEISFRALCLSAYMESHWLEECTYNSVMLCFIDTRSSITLLALPLNSWSIQYLNEHGCNTCGHAKYLLPASEPDQLQLKIGYRSWWHLSPVLTTIPSLCSSSRCSSCKINRQNGTFSSQIEPL